MPELPETETIARDLDATLRGRTIVGVTVERADVLREVDADELARRLGDDRLLVLDARTPDRYRGAPTPLDPVGGRIPGAHNLPYDRASPVPDDVLEAPEIVVYCGSGVTACVDLLALALAGRPDAKLYPGSWSDWSRRGLPADQG